MLCCDEGGALNGSLPRKDLPEVYERAVEAWVDGRCEREVEDGFRGFRRGLGDCGWLRSRVRFVHTLIDIKLMLQSSGWTKPRDPADEGGRTSEFLRLDLSPFDCVY